MPATSRALDRAVEILSDGRWHDRDSVITEATRKVPSSYAMRRADGGRTTPRKRPRSDVERQTSGQWRIAYESVQAAIKRGRFEERVGDSGRPEIRDPGLDYLSLSQLAAKLGRNVSAVSGWVNDEAITSALRAQLPPDVAPWVPGRGRTHKVPVAALDAWRRFSDTRPRPVSARGHLVESIAAAMEVPRDTAEALFDKLRAELRSRGLYISMSLVEAELGRKARNKKRAGPPTDAHAEQAPEDRDVSGSEVGR